MPKVTGDSNIQWNMELAKKLDKADGKEDGKISASVWNGYLNKMGSSGNKIKSFISIDDAAKSLNFYAEKKDAGKVDWKGRWEHMLNILTGKAKEVPTEEPVAEVPKGNAGDPAPAEDPKTVKPAGNSGKSAPVKEAPLTKVAPEEDEEETMVAHDNSGKTSDIKGRVSIEDADENGTPETITITDNSSGKDHVYKFEFVKLDDQNRPIYKAVSMNGKPISGNETYTLDQKDGKTALIQYEGQGSYGTGLKTQLTAKEKVQQQYNQLSTATRKFIEESFGQQGKDAMYETFEKYPNILKKDTKPRQGSNVTLRGYFDGDKEYMRKFPLSNGKFVEVCYDPDGNVKSASVCMGSSENENEYGFGFYNKDEE